MARIKHLPLPDAFSQLDKISDEIGEHRDCTVKALALITGVEYGTVHSALGQSGRKSGQGCHRYVQENALKLLGYKMVQIPFKDRHAIIASYPGQHCNLHHLTTRHPVRFKAQWANVPDCLLYVRGHVAAYVDGVVQDYTVNRSSRIYDMYTVEKINA